MLNGGLSSQGRLKKVKQVARNAVYFIRITKLKIYLDRIPA